MSGVGLDRRRPRVRAVGLRLRAVGVELAYRILRDPVAHMVVWPWLGPPTPPAVTDPMPDHPTGLLPDRHRRPRKLLRRARRVVVIAVLVVAAFVLGADPAHAQPVVLAQAQSLQEVFDNFRGFLVGIAVSLGMLFWTLAGIRYMASGADPGEATRAKEAFRNGAIGFGVAVLTPVLFQILQGILGMSG